MNFTTQQGATPYPAGANVCPDGSVNFSVEAPGAGEVLLVLEPLAGCEFQRAEINLSESRIGNIFFARLKGIPLDKITYYYLIDGVAVTDPCARVLYGKEVWGQKPEFVKCGILKMRNFGFQSWTDENYRKKTNQAEEKNGVRRNAVSGTEQQETTITQAASILPKSGNTSSRPIPLKDTIIYRLHVRGFSMKNGRKSAGTFQGLIEKLPYIHDLGATLVELMPAYDFDETTYRQKKKSARYYGTPEISTGINYWGYTTADYFAPKTSFCVDKTGPGAVKEFTKLVEAVHAQGMELGMEFYFPDEVPAAFACECLRYWVMQYGIDAVHLSCRDEIVRCAQAEAVLVDVKIFANSWVVPNEMRAYTASAASVYANPDYPWTTSASLNHGESETVVSEDLNRGKSETVVSENLNHGKSETVVSEDLNHEKSETSVLSNKKNVSAGGKLSQSGAASSVRRSGLEQKKILRKQDEKRTATYQESFLVNTRRFLMGEQDTVGAMKYEIKKNPRENGVINYLAGHNTMTLADVFSYERKHNEANGEQNRDGTDYNYSANGGVEGPTTKKSVLTYRKRQIKNALALLFLSEGTPMIMAGDEWGRSQGGNNNPYNQDNDINWLSWKRNKFENDILTCTKELIRLRKENPIFHTGEELQGSDYRALGFPDLSWHGETAWQYSENPADRYFAAMYYGKYAAEPVSETVQEVSPVREHGRSAKQEPKNKAGNSEKKAEKGFETVRTRKDRNDRLYYFACNMSGEKKSFGVPTLAREKLWVPLFTTDELTACDGKILTLAAHSVAVYVSDES